MEEEFILPIEDFDSFCVDVSTGAEECGAEAEATTCGGGSRTAYREVRIGAVRR
jgi:hypothetical protein